jgi:hypothetical protein
VEAEKEDFAMPSSNLENEADSNQVEPLLPIEKKLIGYSLGLGLVLLVILVALNHLFPVKI